VKLDLQVRFPSTHRIETSQHFIQANFE